MLTPSQIRWAAQHDWYLHANRDGTITVIDCVLNTITDEYTETPLIWRGSFAELRTWAGY